MALNKAKVLARVSAQESAFVTVRASDDWRNLLPGVDYKMLLFDYQHLIA